MPGDLLFTLTLVTNFICMALTMWFAIYLLVRGLANPLTFRAVVALLALTFYYINAIVELVRSGTSTDQVRSLSILIALIATNDLTHYMLSLPLRRKLYWIARAILIMGIIGVVLLFSPTKIDPCDPRYLCPSMIRYPWVIVDSLKVLIVGAILANLWLIKRNKDVLVNLAFYGTILFGASTILYGLIGTVFQINLPRFIPNLLIVATTFFLLYSAARGRMFINRRSSTYEIPISLGAIVVVVGIYVVTAFQLGLTYMEILILSVLAIFTHSAYDFVRDLLQQLLRKQEHHLRQELRTLAQEKDPEQSLKRFLHRSLAILCHNLRAQSGWIVITEGDRCTVVASLHSLPVGYQFPRKELRQESEMQAAGTLMGQRYSITSAFAGQEEVAIVGLQARDNKLALTQEDVYWMEDIAAEIGWMTRNLKKQPSGISEAVVEFDEELTPEQNEEIAASNLLSKLAYRLDPQLVRAVEEGFRNLNDYSKLGKSSLAGMLGIQAQDHIASGKQVQRKLIDMVSELRPAEEIPAEPLPREWYAYTILHDAYIDERLAREIMARLYISEGTYFRLRRQALRGVARALLETGNITVSGSP